MANLIIRCSIYLMSLRFYNLRIEGLQAARRLHAAQAVIRPLGNWKLDSVRTFACLFIVSFVNAATVVSCHVYTLTSAISL